MMISLFFLNKAVSFTLRPSSLSSRFSGLSINAAQGNISFILIYFVSTWQLNLTILYIFIYSFRVIY